MPLSFAYVRSYQDAGTAMEFGKKLLTGEKLLSQTMIHCLGIFSTTYDNKETAKTLFDFMEGAALKSIVSEWWHFQDNDAQNSLSLEWANDGGVCIRGWTCDGVGGVSETHRADM